MVSTIIVGELWMKGADFGIRTGNIKDQNHFRQAVKNVRAALADPAQGPGLFDGLSVEQTSSGAGSDSAEGAAR